MKDHAKRISDIRTRVQNRRAKNNAVEGLGDAMARVVESDWFDGMSDKTLYALRDQLAHSSDDGATKAQRMIVEEIQRRRRLTN